MVPRNGLNGAHSDGLPNHPSKPAIFFGVRVNWTARKQTVDSDQHNTMQRSKDVARPYGLITRERPLISTDSVLLPPSAIRRINSFLSRQYSELLSSIHSSFIAQISLNRVIVYAPISDYLAEKAESSTFEIDSISLLQRIFEGDFYDHGLKSQNPFSAGKDGALHYLSLILEETLDADRQRAPPFGKGNAVPRGELAAIEP